MVMGSDGPKIPSPLVSFVRCGLRTQLVPSHWSTGPNSLRGGAGSVHRNEK
jgi:hypothetical protein